MECRDCEAKLSWYLDGEAPELEAHLAGCAECREKLEALRKTDGLLAKAAVRLQDQAAGGKPVQIPTRRRGLLRWGFLATAAAALIGVAGWRGWIENQEAQVQQISVLGAPTWVEGATGSMRVLVRNGQTMKAIAGAKVVAEIAGGARVEAISGEDGCADVRLPVPAARDAVLILTVISAKGEDRITKKVTIERPVRVLISTDKPLYQPGQTVHLRVLAMDDVLLKPFQGDVALEIVDSNGNKVERKALMTSAFGIASFDLDLADEVLLGPWHAKATAGGVESERVFDVKRYVLPKFRVDLATDQRFYAPGRIMIADVDANYLFGKPCAGAEVRVTLSHWLGDDFKEAGTAIALADEKGHARVNLDIPKKLYGTEIEGGNALLRCEAAVTDTAGHVERKAVLLPVTAVPIRIVAVPEGGEYIAGVPQNMYIVCSYPDGRPAQAWVRFKGQGERLTDENGVLEVPIAEPRFELLARDEDGRSGRLLANLERDAGRAEQDFLLRMDFSQYRTGQTMQVTVLSRTDGPVYLDLTRGAFTYLTKTVEVVKGRGDIAIDLPPDLRGSARVAAYRVRPDGHVWRDSRPVVVLPAKGLEIRPAVRPEPFRPGDEMTAEVQVFGPDGNPAPSALSVSVVDEAVFALNDARPGLEATYFAIQEDLLKPRLQFRTAGSLASNDPTPARVAIAEKPPAPLFATSEWRLRFAQFESWRREERETAQTCLAGVAAIVVAIWSAILMGRVTPTTRFSFAIGLGSVVCLALVPGGIESAPVLVVLAMLMFGVGCVAQISRNWGAERATGVAAIGLGACLLFVIVAALLPSLAVRRGRITEAVGSAAPSEDKAFPLAMRGPGIMGDPTVWGVKKDDSDGPVAALPPRLREYFPETLYWNPQIVTDDQGRATLRFPGADSITTWRMGMSAVDRGGRLGAMDAPLRVFQPFFADIDLPLELTQGDEVWIPVTVYNYLRTAQSVKLAFEAESGFELLDDAGRTLEIAANDVRSVYFHVKATTFGRHRLKVTATSPEFADALRRSIDVVPDGREMPISLTMQLENRASAKFTVPAEAVDGASRAFVRLYPSRVADALAGLEGIIQMPHGCFEQTSSTVWPNVLVKTYLEKSGRLTPEIRLKVDAALDAGYQRLLTFEVKGGGFDWYGQEPAKTILTAYGIMEFSDMAKVRHVDPAIIDRAKAVLFRRQLQDGGWEADKNTHTFYQLAGGRLTITAYIAWALRDAGLTDPQLEKARAFVAAHAPEATDTYTKALVALALGGRADFKDLEREAVRENGLAHWSTRSDGLVGARGSSANVEGSALATIAMERGRSAISADAAAWLSAKRGKNGDWGTTHATVLAIKALLENAGKSRVPEKPVTVRLRVNGKEVLGAFRQVKEDTFDLVQQAEIPVVKGENTVELECDGELNASFQVSGRTYIPWHLAPRPETPALSIEVAYDRTEIDLDGVLHTMVAITNREARAGMLIADLGVPPGFEPETATLQQLVDNGTIDKFAVGGSHITLYIRRVDPGSPLRIGYGLRPRFPIIAQAPASGTYEYYAPENNGVTGPRRITVKERK